MTLALAIPLAAGPAYAQDFSVHGRLALQDVASFARDNSLDAALGAQERNDLRADFRAKWEPAWDNWSAAIHYVATVQSGDSIELARQLSGLLPRPALTWLDLSDRFIDDDVTIGVQRVDRLSLAYTTPDFVFRIGRQALTWGSGLVFRPMDLFNPFSPDATDTEYKPGTDMAYAQLLFDDGSDLQIIAAPRGDQEGDEPSANESSMALHLQKEMLGHQTTWLLARDHGDWVAALGVNGALGESTWNIEVVPTFLNDGGTRTSVIANISNAATLFDRNATFFVEYFHNGFGVDESEFSLATLPSELVDRLSRGQVFNRRKNFLAGGLSLEVDPLFTLSPSLIVSLDDGSAYAILSGAYSLGDNLNLIAGVQAPIGPPNTEFGGMPLTPGAGPYLHSPAQAYFQLRSYF